MPSIDTVDCIDINAPAHTLFDIVLDYPRMREWYPRYSVELIDGSAVMEGSRLRHELSPPGSPLKSRFTRTVHRIKRPNTIEESYDDGDLVGIGRWEFEALGPDSTRVSFFCQVRSNTLLMHIGFWLAGERGHKMVYAEILSALKTKAEGSAN